MSALSYRGADRHLPSSDPAYERPQLILNFCFFDEGVDENLARLIDVMPLHLFVLEIICKSFHEALYNIVRLFSHAWCVRISIDRIKRFRSLPATWNIDKVR
jgi:hypothetical protein